MSGEQWAAARPQLTPENEIVAEIWSFCGGWHPALIVDAAVYYGVEDLDWLTAQLLALREKVREHQAAVEKAKGRHG